MAGTVSWVCGTASARGSSHALSDVENQDSAATYETDDGVAVAVADGHGGSRYVRSATGSSIAVDVARQFAAELLRSHTDLATAAAALPPQIVAEWRRRIDADLAAHPLDPQTATVVGPDPRLAYGATLLLVVCRRDQAVALQLGDGDVAAAWDDGTVSSPVPPEPRNVGGQTTSLCLIDAERSFRLADLRRDGAVPVAVLAATDGYGNSFANDDWAPGVMHDLLEQRRSGGPDSVFSAMPTWAAESAAVGGDDTTVALVFRTGVPLNATAPPLGATTSAAVPQARPGRHWAGYAIAGIVGLAAGSIVGFVAGDGENESRNGTPVDSSVLAATTMPAPVTTPTPIRPVTVPPPTSTVAPPIPSTSTAGTVPPSTANIATTVASPPTQPPVTDPVDPTNRSVVMAVGPYRAEQLDPFSDPIAIESVRPGEGATPIGQVLTTGGRWDAVDATLRFTPRDGSPMSVWEPDGETRIAGLAFTAGRVVAAAITATDTGDMLTVGVFDGTSGGELAISAQRAVDDS